MAFNHPGRGQGGGGAVNKVKDRTVAQLKVALKARGLLVGGKKAELLARLLEAEAEEEEEEEEEDEDEEEEEAHAGGEPEPALLAEGEEDDDGWSDPGSPPPVAAAAAARRTPSRAVAARPKYFESPDSGSDR